MLKDLKRPSPTHLPNGLLESDSLSPLFRPIRFPIPIFLNAASFASFLFPVSLLVSKMTYLPLEHGDISYILFKY